MKNLQEELAHLSAQIEEAASIGAWHFVNKKRKIYHDLALTQPSNVAFRFNPNQYNNFHVSESLATNSSQFMGVH